MALFDPFGKKKKELKASCPITKEPIEPGFGYMLTTAQVISSQKYWDMVMTEPETLSYTVSHFNNQASGTQMRSMIFEKFAGIGKAWIVSDSVIAYFDVDRSAARQEAKKWWETEGQHQPANAGPAAEHLPADAFQTFRDYAILEAGRQRASATRAA